MKEEEVSTEKEEIVTKETKEKDKEKETKPEEDEDVEESEIDEDLVLGIVKKYLITLGLLGKDGKPKKTRKVYRKAAKEEIGMRPDSDWGLII